MVDSGFRLGIDFGTSNTVAVLRWPDGRTKPLLFDGSPLLPSAVYINPDGTILTGRDAVHSARLQPHRFEPYPKRRVEEGTVWLGERDVPVVDLVTAVLKRVAAESYRVAGTNPAEVNITHPATWPPQRRQTLAQAAAAAGFSQPFLSSEPVAAASYFVGTVGTHVPVGGVAVVYDFGAGTFDASVVRRNAGGGFDVLASEGLPDAGGLDVDAAVVAYLGKHFTGREGDQWQRLTNPESEADRRAAWQLWEDARLAKEMLSRAANTYVHVPLYDESVPIGREQLEQLAKTILDRTVTATQIAVGTAGVTNSALSAVFLVGGSSRIPLAATLLHRAFGLAPTAIEQPELVVAEGALHLAPPTGRAQVSGAPAGNFSAPVSGVPAQTSGGPVSGGEAPTAPVSASPVSPAFSMPTMAPGLPPLLRTGPMPVVPPATRQPPPQPEQPQGYQQPQRPVPPAPTMPQRPPVAAPPIQQPPVQQPQFQQRPPVVQPPAVQPVQQRPPVVQPPAVPGWGVAQPAPPVHLQRPPAGRRNRTLAAAVGGGVVALLLVAGGIVWFTNRGDGDDTGGPTGTTAPAVAAACGHKVGFIGELSGDGSKDSAIMRNSAKLAVDTYNSKHPDCHVGFAEFDTLGTEDGSRAAADKLVADPEVIAAVGPAYRTEILAAGPVLEKGGVAFFAPYAADADLATRGWATFHRLLGNDKDQAAAGGRYLKSTLRAQKVVVVYDDSDYGTIGRQGTSNVLGSTVTTTVAVKQTDTDWTNAVKQVTSANADAVYFAGEAADGTSFLKALRTAKPTMPVVVSNRLFTQKFVDTLAASAAGIVVVCPCAPPDKTGEDYASRYQAAIGDSAGYYGPEAYDGAGIVLAGFTAGKGSRSEMLDFVGKYNGQGIARSYKFTTSGDLDVPDAKIWSYKIDAQGYTNPDAVIAP